MTISALESIMPNRAEASGVIVRTFPGVSGKQARMRVVQVGDAGAML